MHRASSYALLGTASHVGKSLLTVALCRYLRGRSIAVAPFKAVNIALNSWITARGAEIGLAQAQQALAAGIPPDERMNPVLMKPSSEGRVQYVVCGRVNDALTAMRPHERRDYLRKVIQESFGRLASEADLVLIEGSGGTAEVNLRDRDLSNLWLARTTRARCVLVADIDRGGVFASILGTLELLSKVERSCFDGFIVNKFAGDPSEFSEGLRFLVRKSKLPCLGVIPLLGDLNLAEEDALSLRSSNPPVNESSLDHLRIGVLKLPHISNFSDFSPLAREQSVDLRYLTDPQTLHDMHVLVLPGTKSTIHDLKWMRKMGWDTRVADYSSKGGYVVGICGGLQMLGLEIDDPYGVESPKGTSTNGLGLLPIRTGMARKKVTKQVHGRVLNGNMANEDIRGFEIHMGRSEFVSGTAVAFLRLQRTDDATSIDDGCISSDGNTWGTYVHGLFDNDGFRFAFLNGVRRRVGLSPVDRVGSYSSGGYDSAIDRWTEHVVAHLEPSFLQTLVSASGTLTERKRH
jgi:adenosylcobyric acid synthase